MNLFPLFARKMDFAKNKTSDRFLSRFPFIMLVEDEIKVLIDSVEPTKKILEEIKVRTMGNRKTV